MVWATGVPMWVEYVGAGAAAASALVAAWAAREAGHAAKSAASAATAAADLARIENERWDTEREAARHARLVVSSSLDTEHPPDPPTPGWLAWIVIDNLGPAGARDLTFSALSRSARIAFHHKQPIPVVHPQGQFRGPIGRVGPGPWVFSVELRWTDDAGSHEETHLVSCAAPGHSTLPPPER